MKATHASDQNAIRETAATWLIQLEDCNAEQKPALEEALAAWLKTDAQHRQVFEQMQQMWGSVDPDVAKAKRRRRRTVASGLAMFALSAWLLLQLPWAYWQADYRTATGEILTIELPDGSRAMINTRSAINLQYDDQGRTIELVQGEVMTDVRPDNTATSRVFRVDTPHGSVTALGTRFSVRLESDQTRVRVQESQVRVTPDRQGPHATLAAGQQARFNPQRVTEPEASDANAFDWTQDRLVFVDAPLSDVVERLNQFRPGMIAVFPGSPELQRRRFTGVLPARDSEAALRLLVDSLNLRARQITPLLTWLESPS